MENTENTEMPKDKKAQDSGIEINPKQAVTKKGIKKAVIVNVLTFVVIALCFYWLIAKYFHIGDKDYTESAQVEEFINPINTRVSAYIKEIKFYRAPTGKKRGHAGYFGQQGNPYPGRAGRSSIYGGSRFKKYDIIFREYRFQ